jgi:hypothetical protein
MTILITPTGARPQQFALCAEWMRKQTYADAVTWIIIDDALPRCSDCVGPDFRAGWQIIKTYPDPAWQAGQNTQARNLAAGITIMRLLFEEPDIDAIFIIEDDDYYPPRYLQETRQRLNGFDLAGELYTIYYNVVTRRWLRNGNIYWSSLFQTAFTPAALPAFEANLQQKFIDCHFFPAVKNKNMFYGFDFSVGIKGQLGRGGIGMGHGDLISYQPDPTGAKLRELLGADADHYLL